MKDLTRQGDRLAGQIVQDIYDDFWAKSSFRYDQTNYEMVGSDEAEELGFQSDDPYLTMLRRKSDGQLFEMEIEVTAYPVDPPAAPAPAEIPGQQTLLEVTK